MLQEIVGQVVLPVSPPFRGIEAAPMPSIRNEEGCPPSVPGGIASAARAGTWTCEALLAGRHGRPALWISG
ncbi:hypothetical protein [Kitasatospora arboriphila]|uniref:hypothetical protein n=1 Tax=Kitasatospora arboriphila TaxID=258052 RepID=UPI0031D7E9B8